MRIALAQLNVVVGDLEGNVERIVGAVEEAARASADLVVLPELAVTGYPPKTSSSVPASSAPPAPRSRRSRGPCTDTVALVGCPAYDRDLANAAFVCATARCRGSTASTSSPTTASSTSTATSAGARAAAARARGRPDRPTICEDVWQPGPPATDLALAGATLLVNLSASPFHGQGGGSRGDARDAGTGQRGLRRVLQPRRRPGRARLRRPLGRARRRGRSDRPRARVRGGAARRRRRPDRGDRAPAARCAAAGLARSLPAPPAATIRIGTPRDVVEPVPATVVPFEPELEQMRLALGLGLRDYVTKNGFGDVVLGISGGIDSALRPRSPLMPWEPNESTRSRCRRGSRRRGRATTHAR